MNPRSPHDRFVKAILRQPGKAKAYFLQELPERLLGVIDLNGLEQVSESFVDETLKESFSDLLFKVPLKGKKGGLYLSLLLEHKSSADPYVTIQMGHYIFSALLQQVRQGKRPNLVIPMLLYHGRDPMPYKTHRQLFEDLGADLMLYVPDYEYVYHDLQSSREETITEGHIAGLRSMFLLLKYAHDESTLLMKAGRILTLAGEEGNLFKTYFVYFVSLVKEKARIMESILDLPNPLQREAQNAYEEWILEGVEKGLKKGRAEGRAEGLAEGSLQTLIKSVKGLFLNGASVGLIARSLEISESQVETILHEAGLLKAE